MRAITLSLLAVAVAAMLLAAGCTAPTKPILGVGGVSPSQLNGRLVQNLTVNTTAAPNALILSSNLSLPSGVGQPFMYLGVLWSANRSVVLSVTRYGGGNNDSVEQLNAGVALVAGGTYTFVVPIAYGEELNFVSSAYVHIDKLAVEDLYEGDYSAIKIVNGT
jgi:hypothetical protein